MTDASHPDDANDVTRRHDIPADSAATEPVAADVERYSPAPGR